MKKNKAEKEDAEGKTFGRSSILGKGFRIASWTPFPSSHTPTCPSPHKENNKFKGSRRVLAEVMEEQGWGRGKNSDIE